MTGTIVHLITGLWTGGAERQLARLVMEAQGDEGRHVVISMTDAGDIGPTIRAAGITLHTLGMKRGRPTLLGFWRLALLLRRLRPAILQTWLYHADLLGWVAAKVSGTRHVVWNLRCSDMDMRRYSRLSRLVVAILARLSPWVDAVVYNSSAGREAHARLGYHPRRWQHIPNGFDLSEFSPSSVARDALRRSLGLAPDTPVVGLVARHDPMKDHVGFFRAAALVASRNDAVRFVCAGADVTPDNAVLGAALQDLGLTGRVFLLGRRDDIAAVTAGLDLAVSSSAFGEGFPNSLGEALASGVCCVATDVGDSAKVVGESGLVVPASDPSALALAIVTMLDKPAADRHHLGMAGRERIEREYSVRAMAQRYGKLYSTLLTKG
jgi:glycosyltransferase involved in cell wall biosynthesis